MNWTAFSIVLRESLEALLIIGILTSVLKKNATNQKQWVALYSGVLSGIALSLLMALVLIFLPQALPDSVMSYLDVLFPLIAGLMILQAMWWMNKHARTMKAELSQKVETAVSSQSMVGLFVISFLAVAREGLETVLFLSGEIIEADASKIWNLITQIVLAVACASLLFFILQKTLSRLHYKWFFRVTNILLFAAALQMLYTAYNKYQYL